MNTREEFEKYLSDTELQDTKGETLWKIWQEQQKKIDELILKLDIKDDAMAGYRLVIEELQAGIK